MAAKFNLAYIFPFITNSGWQKVKRVTVYFMVVGVEVKIIDIKPADFYVYKKINFCLWIKLQHTDKETLARIR